MAKHRHLTKAHGRSNRGKKLAPHRRTDISRLPKRERDSLIAYAGCIEALVNAEEAQGGPLPDENLELAAVQFQQSPAEIRKAMAQYRQYHAAHKGEHPANAFTPIPRDFQRRQKKRASDQQQTTTRKVRKPPRPGIELSMITDESERARIEIFAQDILNLRQLQDALGILPPGLLTEVAEKHGYAEVWIRKSIDNQREYCEAYPDHSYERAHTPKPVGRPKGRQVPPEVIRDIEQARVNRKWLSRDGDGGHSEINNVIEKRLLHSLVEETHGRIHSERTTYRIIKDYEERQAARVAVADDGDASILQNHLPAIANRGNIRGPGERAQFDIRPMPVVVDNDGVESTVHVMLVFDDATERITSYELVFTKFIDEEGNEVTQNFDAQTCRATVARSCLEINGRFRTLYADNGFRPLKAYQHFMVAAGEDPTHIIFRRPGRPRGGGGVEVGLKVINGFLQTRPYYVRERDFRRSRKKKRKELKTAEDLRRDFAQYVWHWNNDKDPQGGPSRIERWNAGPNMALTAPAAANLAMYALSQKRDTREPRQDPGCWFTYGDVSYVGARPDPDLYERFAALSIRRSKLEAKKRQEANIKLCIFDFGGNPPQRLVLFSLDDEETWELAVPADARALSWQRHNDMMVKVEQRLEHGDKADLNDFFQRVILGSAKGPLVIDGLSRKRKFYVHQAGDAAQGATSGDASMASQPETEATDGNAGASHEGSTAESEMTNGMTASPLDELFAEDHEPPVEAAESQGQPGEASSFEAAAPAPFPQGQPDEASSSQPEAPGPLPEAQAGEAPSSRPTAPTQSPAPPESTQESSRRERRRRGKAAPQPASTTQPDEDDFDIPDFIGKINQKGKG